MKQNIIIVCLVLIVLGLGYIIFSPRFSVGTDACSLTGQNNDTAVMSPEKVVERRYYVMDSDNKEEKHYVDSTYIINHYGLNSWLTIKKHNEDRDNERKRNVSSSSLKGDVSSIDSNFIIMRWGLEAWRKIKNTNVVYDEKSGSLVVVPNSSEKVKEQSSEAVEKLSKDALEKMINHQDVNLLTIYPQIAKPVELVFDNLKAEEKAPASFDDIFEKLVMEEWEEVQVISVHYTSSGKIDQVTLHIKHTEF